MTLPIKHPTQAMDFRCPCAKKKVDAGDAAATPPSPAPKFTSRLPEMAGKKMFFNFFFLRTRPHSRLKAPFLSLPPLPSPLPDFVLTNPMQVLPTDWTGKEEEASTVESRYTCSSDLRYYDQFLTIESICYTVLCR